METDGKFTLIKTLLLDDGWGPDDYALALSRFPSLRVLGVQGPVADAIGALFAGNARPPTLKHLLASYRCEPAIDLGQRIALPATLQSVTLRHEPLSTTAHRTFVASVRQACLDDATPCKDIIVSSEEETDAFNLEEWGFSLEA